jgi:hypothetical protein
LILDKLKPADMDFFDRGQCLAGTRSEVLDFISQWLFEISEQKTVLWLTGVAGSGKSTVATTLAHRISGVKRLGAYVFFDREGSFLQPSSVVRNISYQLGLFDIRLGAAISDILAKNGYLITAPLSDQFQELILSPLKSTDLGVEGPLIIILDSLDKCGDDASRMLLLDLVMNDFPKLPPFVRVLITSRPEMDIKTAFTASTAIYRQVLHTDTASNHRDVARYFRAQCKSIVAKNPLLGLPEDWPGDKCIAALCNKSSGLFGWCATAVKFIGTGQYPGQRLRVLLDDAQRPTVDAELYDLYALILKHSGLWLDDYFIQVCPCSC